MDESEGEGGSEKFKIVDKRRFDSDGNERSDSTVTAEKVAEQKANPDAVKRDAARDRGTESDGPEINFASFIMSIATQALMQLGELPPPPGVQIEKDLSSAKQFIDILALLQQKTTGNLDEQEDKLLEEVLHNLRMSYVRLGGAKSDKNI